MSAQTILDALTERCLSNTLTSSQPGLGFHWLIADLERGPQAGGSQRNPGKSGAGPPRSAVRLQGEASGTAAADVTSHMSGLVHTSDDKHLLLMALLAFERAAFDTCTVRGSISLIEVSPPHAGRESQCAHGGRSGGMPVVLFGLGTLASPWKVQGPIGTSYEGVSIVLVSLGPFIDRVCCNIDHFPNLSRAAAI